MSVHSAKDEAKEDVSKRQFKAFKKGDIEAFKQIFRLHYESLYSNVSAMAVESEAANDIVADTYLKLASERNNMNDIGHVREFLSAVAREKALDHLKSLQKSNE